MGAQKSGASDACRPTMPAVTEIRARSSTRKQAGTAVLGAHREGLRKTVGDSLVKHALARSEVARRAGNPPTDHDHRAFHMV